MISVNYGEVAQYFKDGNTALVANEYDVDQYAEKMKFVLDHPQEAIVIGKKVKNWA